MTSHQSNGVTTNDHTSNHNHTSSALRRMTPFIACGYIFNTICYILVYALLPLDLAPDPEYCPNDKPNCDRRDLFAFQVVSFFNLTYLGLLGFHTFYISKRASSALPPTPQGRLFGIFPEADYINAAIVIFQGWDFIASIFFEEHCTMIMMTHHLLAFTCGFFCLVYEVHPYYAVYFGGVSEFSSIFLCVSQLFQFFPPVSLVPASSILSSILPVFEIFCQAGFIITFILFRIVGWTQKSFMLLSDGTYVIKNGLLQRHSPESGWFLRYLMTLCLGLGGLQVFWLKEIAEKVLEMGGQA